MSKSISYRCKIGGDAHSVFAIPVPFDPKEIFGKVRAPVVVKIGEFSYRSTIAAMGGPLFIPFRKSHREAAGIKLGQEIDVTLTLDEAPRTVELPEDLCALIRALPGGIETWEKASYTHRREYVEAINDAKKPETREKRIALALDFVRSRIKN